jgi:hypothetical protein
LLLSTVINSMVGDCYLTHYQKCDKEIKMGYACSDHPTVATVRHPRRAKMGQNGGKTDRHKYYLIHKL